MGLAGEVGLVEKEEADRSIAAEGMAARRARTGLPALLGLRAVMDNQVKSHLASRYEPFLLICRGGTAACDMMKSLRK